MLLSIHIEQKKCNHCELILFDTFMYYIQYIKYIYFKNKKLFLIRVESELVRRDKYYFEIKCIQKCKNVYRK